MKEKDKELAENLLCSKRLDMDDALCRMAEIQFFFSSITGVTRNKKRKRSTECEELNEGKDAELQQQDSNSLINETSETEISSQSSSHADSSEAVLEEHDFYPAIAYFVAFTESEDCNANKIFQVLHESETIAQVQQIASRSKKPNKKPNSQRSFLSNNVFKDPYNPAIENIVKKSNEFCFYKALIKRADLETDFWEVYRESDVPGVPLCISKRPSRLVVANREEYETILKNVSRKLCQDGLVFDFVLSSVMCNLPARVSPPSDLENAIDMIQKAMFYFGNALYHGGVYGRPN